VFKRSTTPMGESPRNGDVLTSSACESSNAHQKQGGMAIVWWYRRFSFGRLCGNPLCWTPLFDVGLPCPPQKIQVKFGTEGIPARPSLPQTTIPLPFTVGADLPLCMVSSVSSRDSLKAKMRSPLPTAPNPRTSRSYRWLVRLSVVSPVFHAWMSPLAR